eukprot:3629458-Rhodomonas_salina.5
MSCRVASRDLRRGRRKERQAVRISETERRTLKQKERREAGSKDACVQACGGNVERRRKKRRKMGYLCASMLGGLLTTTMYSS